jgi:hypothetical protein
MEHSVYDAAVIQSLADRLYSQARTVVVKYTVIGAVLFSVIFYFAVSREHNFGLVPTKSLGVGLLIGVVLGFVLGQRKSYQLKLEAQLALCQLQIERNTRTSNKTYQ